MADIAFEKGQADIGLTLLMRAWQQGDLRALMRIGRIYDEGKLISQDRLKACQSYAQAMEKFDKVDRFHPYARLAAEAFRRSADCYAQGLSVGGWERNMNLAANLYFHAGVILQDPVSLFELAKLHLSGEGIAQNPAMAVYYLETSARKRYPPAQALLGSLMWEGKVMKRRPAPALALLMLGKEGTSVQDRAWIITLYEDAVITASKDIEQEAVVLVEKWKAVHGDPAQNALQTASTSSASEPMPLPARSPARQLKGINLNLAKETDSFGNQTTRAVISPSDAASQRK
ncbi:MAG: sel1 repeat family protein [Rhodomicrobium sp.]|nr:sel1 repeat family protein [Rhodomicrobium sp.]